MNLRLVGIYERHASSETFSCFSFEDNFGKVYLCEVSEESPNHTRWYNLALEFCTAKKSNQEVWVDGIKNKPDTVMILEESIFEITTTEKNMSFVPGQTDMKSGWKRTDCE